MTTLYAQWMVIEVDGGDDDRPAKKDESDDRLVEAGDYDLGDIGAKVGEGHTMRDEDIR